MASIKLLLGMIPSTSKIEGEEKALAAEFEKLKSFTESSELSRYNELNGLVSSAGFEQKKKEIEGLRYKGSEEHAREKEFLALSKAKDLKIYFRTAGSTSLKKYRELEGSEKISKYQQLKQTVESAGFREKMKSKDFKSSDDARLLEEYRQLGSNSDIKEFFRFGASREYATFRNLDGSSKLARFNELKEYTASKEFAERKAYLLDKKRFEKTEEHKMLEEFLKLKKNPDIIWYFKVKDSDKFDLLRHRELIFSEEFEGDKLDDKKWLTNYFWGDTLLKDRYSIESDLQFYTEKENFEIRNSYLRINTRPQKVNGKAWSPAKGFTTKEFPYTSGLINTAKSFRQKYGIFSAKIKLGEPGSRSAFWLLGDKITPHINICRTSGGKVWFDIFQSSSKTSGTKLGSRYSAGSYIFTLEWSQSKLVWKINGVEVFTQTENVPQEPMYISLAGGVEKPTGGMTAMEIDWIRVYQPRS